LCLLLKHFFFFYRKATNAVEKKGAVSLFLSFSTNNYLFDKKKGKLFFTVFIFSTRTKKQWKKFFLLSDMKFCFMKRLFYTTLEETRSVGSQKKSAVVAG
jgi:hypothetical protein